MKTQAPQEEMIGMNVLEALQREMNIEERPAISMEIPIQQMFDEFWYLYQSLTLNSQRKKFYKGLTIKVSPFLLVTNY